jgi:hypothetical protein
MQNQMLFIGNVFWHLVASMSGIASFGLSMWERGRNKVVESRIFFAVGLLCLIVAFDQAWQDEHRNASSLVEEKSRLIQERDFWKSQSYDKDSSLRARDEMLSKNYGVLAATQASLANLSNRLLDAAGPVPRKVDVMRWQIPITYTFANTGKVRFSVLEVITNKAISPVRGDLSCDKDFTVVTKNVLTHGSSMQMDYTVLSPKSVHVEFSYPPVSAEHPLVFFVYNREGSDINECSFELDKGQ